MTDTPTLLALWESNFPAADGDNLWVPMRQQELEYFTALKKPHLLPFLLWLRSGNRCYYTHEAETKKYDHVWEWIQAGFVVARFIRGQYPGASKKQVSNYLRELEELGFIKVVRVGTGSKDAGGNLPNVAIVGLWIPANDKPDDVGRRPGFASWQAIFKKALNTPDDEAHEWARANAWILKVKRENRKGVER